MSEEQQWIMHYSTSHKMLLVGEGDFSFSACLARAFGSAKNMISTSLDSKETLMVKHPTARANLKELEKLEGTVLHEVDCRTMNNHPSLKTMKFDRIIFNFPHSGYHYRHEQDCRQIKLHQEVVKGFFRSAGDMLKDKGEVHVTRRTDYPYNKWELEKLAKLAGLCLAEKVEFRKQDYPGYNIKRGYGKRSNRPFRTMRVSSTFKFIQEIHFDGLANAPFGPYPRKKNKRKKKAYAPFDAVAHIACMWLDKYDPF